MSDKYMINNLSYKELLEQFNDSTPLQLSRVLIQVELFDKQSSINVMESIYKEFETKENVINELINPLLLNIADGMVKHPKLGDIFKKTNITPTRIVKEVNEFHYELDSEYYVNDNQFMVKAEKEHYLRQKYEIKSRRQTEKEKGIERQNGSGQVEDAVTGKTLEMREVDASGDLNRHANMDHVTPLKHMQEKYKNNPYLHRSDLAQLAGLPENETYINSTLNKKKGDLTWKEFIKKNPDDLTPEQQEKVLELESKSEKAIADERNKIMAKNVGLQGLGDAIILLMKPIWFEIKDSVKNGILYGFDTTDKIKAFGLRMKRAYIYIRDNVIPKLGEFIKDVMSNFLSILINSVVDIFKSIFKSLLSIIVNGFLAIKEAFNILLKPDSEMSKAQKADAITKIIATAVVPILIFSFEQNIGKVPIIGDVLTLILSGIATTMVVWLLNEIDIFSVKSEKRMKRIEEIFSIRIKIIKENTNIFETASIEHLAKTRMQFHRIANNIKYAVSNNMDANSSVYELASFMGINLSIKSTNEFLALLETENSINI